MNNTSACRGRKLAPLVLSLALLVRAVYAQTIQNFVRPGETVSIPLPIQSATDSADTVSSMKITVTGDGSFITNPIDSAVDTVAPGETKIFIPSFVVGDVPDGTYRAILKMVTPDQGIDPDPPDPSSNVQVSFMVGTTRFPVENAA
jgi:hypothetical protein